MPESIALHIKPDHVEGGFEWEVEPECTCGQIKMAFEAKFIFASNVSDAGNSLLYMMPLTSDGTLVRRKGIQITFCPWCGDRIRAHKKFENK